jgi:hypothetical protein
MPDRHSWTIAEGGRFRRQWRFDVVRVSEHWWRLARRERGRVRITTGAEVTDSLTEGGGAAFSQCCLKRKAAPNTSNASSNSAKMNFGLISVPQHKQKIQDRNAKLGLGFKKGASQFLCTWKPHLINTLLYRGVQRREGPPTA